MGYLVQPRLTLRDEKSDQGFPAWSSCINSPIFMGVNQRIELRRAIPRLAEFARITTNSFGPKTPKAGWSIRLSHQKVVWWTRGDSNPRPPRCEQWGK